MGEVKQVNKSTRKKSQRPKKRTAKKVVHKRANTQQEAPALRKEVKGIIVIAIALISLIGLFGGAVGLGGNFITSIFQYGFGYGAIVPCLGLLWLGARQLYVGKWFSITKRGCLWTLLFFLLLSIVPMIKVPAGSELLASNLLNNGGLVGALITTLLRTIFGQIGSILLTIALLIGCVILISRLSLSRGLHVAKDKTEGVRSAMKDAAVERAQVMKEQITNWNEQRKEAIAERKAYNREQDDRYGAAAQAALEAVHNTRPQEDGHNTSSQEDVHNTRIQDEVANEPFNPYVRAYQDIPNKETEVVSQVPSRQAEPVQAVSMKGVSSHDGAKQDTVKQDTIKQDIAVPDEDTTSLEARDNHEVVENPYSAYEASRTSSDLEDYTKAADEDYVPPIDDDDHFTDFTPFAEPEAPFIRPSVLNSPYKRKEAAQLAAQMATTSPSDIRSLTHLGTSHTKGGAPTNLGTSTVSLVRDVPEGEGATADTAAVAVETNGQSRSRSLEPYRFPSLEMLAKGGISQVDSEEVAHNANLLETTLDSFGIKAKVVNATKGPAVTRYELEPAPGTKVSKIVNLTDDLKLSLAAADIRMEAPIPGKSAIGIEVPNRSISPVHLRDVLDCDDFKHASGGIPVGLGKDIAGKPIITDLAKMPHLLVAGSTGSGKSVCINTLISSILFSRKPEEVKLILIDPKMVELSTYNGIPHLMLPVVTDMKKAAAALRWAVREMEARYRTFAATGVRNVQAYNKAHPQTAMPLILIIIDELADLMMTAPQDIEESISRLAQMARAAGLHMVLATQRPSVNVITGTIKANVPSRISFAVATQIDSRTILDMGGAEKLLGKGDMLFAPIGSNKPVRIQGCFISDEEVEKLVDFVKTQGTPSYDESIVQEEEKEDNKDNHKGRDEEQDELLERAVNLVLDSGQASVSMLQRRFRIGYSRAARLMDTMEEMKIVGTNNGSKAREILMTKAEVMNKYFPNISDEQ